jgi:hypothetical protein
VEMILREGLEAAMTRYNRKKKTEEEPGTQE